jgi:galactonate dehydratase
MTSAGRIRSVTPLHIEKHLFVEVTTEDGRTGTGEAGVWGHIEATAAAVQKYGEYLVGRSADLIEDHWNMMHRFSHYRGAAIMGAISAIDIALWDLKGQKLGEPIHALLGGPTRTTARVYGHVKADTREGMVAACLDLKRRGFTAVGHLNPFLDESRDIPYARTHAQKLGEGVATLAAIREAVGPEVDLCVEIHRRLTPAEAITFAEEIAPLRPLFYEDPIRPDSVDSMARVARHISLPIATGERLVSLYEFQQLLTREAVAYVRPSIGLCGGITGARKIAALAEAHDVQVVPHNPFSPVILHAGLHLAAAIPNFAIQEYPTAEWADDTSSIGLRGEHFVTEVAPLEAGYACIPTAPGLGTRLPPDASTRFPAVPRPVFMRRHRDGSVLEQ